MNGRDPALMKANAKARLRRGMFLLPSLFTVGNIAAGYFSITETIKAISGDAQSRTWTGRPSPSCSPSLRRAGRAHCPHDQHHQRVWQGAGFAGRRHHLWRGAQPAGSDLGISFSARYHQPAVACSTCMQAGAFICFLFLIGGVSRLARFNISHDAQPRIRAGRAASILWACRFRRRRDCWPPLCTSSTVIRWRSGGSQFPGSSWWG
jgi:CDP-diacylglycerol--serine O-phosphatidyltransferase